jgi:predicted nucleic acid-binding protein
MKSIFADTGYWIALLSPGDGLHGKVQEVSATLAGATIVTSDWVQAELLNSFAGRGPQLRQVASTAVVALKENPNVIVVVQSRDSFTQAFDLYRERADKGWSLTDCSSFLIMRQRGIDAALTGDKHFEQAGFSALMR